jgi:cell division transport system permease protein
MVLLDIVKRNIRRTPYQALAASMVMFFTFLVLTVFLLLAIGSEQILNYYESKPQAIAFFKDGTKDSDINIIQEALLQTGRVTGFKYVSKDDALSIYKERNKNNPLLLELVTANILPASLEISTVTPDDLKIVADLVKKEPVVEEVVFPEDVVASLTSATRVIRTVGGAVTAFLITFSTMIIVMIIGFKIRIKREEIGIMKLLGASGWFIRLPYLTEGVFYAVSGAILGWLVSFGLLWYFEPILINSLGEVSSVLFPVSLVAMAGFFAIVVVVAIIIGAIGSAVAVRRYLRI